MHFLFARARCDGAEHLHRLDGVGAQLRDRLLRTPEARRGDHLHRSRDLLRVLDADDPLTNDLEVRHRSHPLGGHSAASLAASSFLDFFFLAFAPDATAGSAEKIVAKSLSAA